MNPQRNLNTRGAGKSLIPANRAQSQPKTNRNNRRRLKQQSTLQIAPVAVSSRQVFPVNSRSANSRRFSNRELVATVMGSVSFQQVSFSLNPGLIATFPWLSTQADSWQQYRFHRLTFRYVTRSPTSAAGSVILSPEYNPEEPAPIDEATASNTQGAVEDVTWREIVCSLNVSSMFPIGPKKYLRQAAVADALTTYDVGTMHVCTIGQADGAAIGKLWVEYDVELFVPQTLKPSMQGACCLSEYSHVENQSLSNGLASRVLWDAPLYNPLRLVLEDSTDLLPPKGVYLFDLTLNVYAQGLSDVLTVTARILKNGSPLDPAVFSSYRSIAGTTGSDDLTVPIRVFGTVSCSGTDYVSFDINASTDAGGTLLIGGGGRLIARVA